MRRTGAAFVTLAAVVCAFTPAASAGMESANKSHGEGARERRHPKFHDVRSTPRRDGIAGAPKPTEAAALRRSLGVHGVVDLDEFTGTPRHIARVDGYLTEPSSAAAETVALEYLLAHRDVFALDDGALAGLALRRTYVDIGGTTHLAWVQQVDGVPVFGNGLEAHVAADGRLIAVQGSPLPTLPAHAGTPQLSAADARDLAAANVDRMPQAGDASERGGPRRAVAWANGDRAELVLFATGAGLRLAWQTYVQPGPAEAFTHVIDHETGEVLYRSEHAVHAGEALVFDNYPGASVGGTQQPVDLVASGWLPPAATTLSGPFAHAFADVDGDGVADPQEEVAPPQGAKLRYPFERFDSSPLCDEQFWCSWDPAQPNSWQKNRKQATTQTFAYVSRFHDHLLAAPFGFTPAAGNFEASGGDAVQVHALLGAAGPFPAGNNAFMITPPDGVPPHMALYLFGHPFVPGHTGDAADTVYHEYVHGLSWRLVTDALGNAALNGHQAGSMGEAWSDWYAMDYLVAEGIEQDTPVGGELSLGKYPAHGEVGFLRTEGVDCPLGAGSSGCPGTPGAGPGGYTYGDLGNVFPYPEVHADGEIFAQTLWDLRSAIGVDITRSVVTRAMELSPNDPSFLDMRNAIVQADVVNHGGEHMDEIWQVFAQRGMGYFAGSAGTADTKPAEDFSLPPAPGTSTATLSGTVIDALSGEPVPGVTVAIAGLNSGFIADHAAVTDATGNYSIPEVFVGTYRKVTATLPGWEPGQVELNVSAPVTKQDFAIRRDWMATAGGAVVTETNGDEFADLGCGTLAAIDQSQGTAWSPGVELDAGGTVTPKVMVVALPAAIDMTSLEIDPTANCFDDPTSSVGPYRIETSVDGSTWVLAASGTFGPADLDRFNVVAVNPDAVSGVRYVRVTLLGPQIDLATQCAPVQGTGCLFMDMTEVAVYGTP